MAPPPAYLGEFEQLLLLAILRLQPDTFGTDIARELEERAGRSVSRAALYTAAWPAQSRHKTRRNVTWSSNPSGTMRATPSGRT
jgi:hypothetical protein